MCSHSSEKEGSNQKTKMNCGSKVMIFTLASRDSENEGSGKKQNFFSIFGECLIKCMQKFLLLQTSLLF